MPPFDLQRLERETGLAAVEYFEELPSTNTWAVERAAEGTAPVPLLVLADHQPAGRGRGTNRWWGGRGGLTFSLLVDRRVINFPKRNWPLVSLTAALGVAETLEPLLPGTAVRIKWPNDVYVNGRKICGILVETSAVRPDALIIGIGVNVNNSLVEAPAELQSTATSLIDLAARPFDRTRILIAVVRRLLELLPTLDIEPWPHAESWRARCYLQGRTVQLDSGGRLLYGVCQGIDDRGALLLLGEGGIQRCFGGVVKKVL